MGWMQKIMPNICGHGRAAACCLCCTPAAVQAHHLQMRTTLVVACLCCANPAIWAPTTTGPASHILAFNRCHLACRSRCPTGHPPRCRLTSSSTLRSMPPWCGTLLCAWAEACWHQAASQLNVQHLLQMTPVAHQAPNNGLSLATAIMQTGFSSSCMSHTALLMSLVHLSVNLSHRVK